MTRLPTMLTALLLTCCAAAAGAATGKPEPFRIAVPDAVLRDLKARLLQTRFPEQVPGSGWDYGTDTAYLKELVGYWARDYDWRKAERRLNALHQYRVDIDGSRIHYVHERGKGPKPIPVLMMHGWPSSFLQFEKIIPLLTDPGAHGAPGGQSFDVVVVSLPGFGFSDAPLERGFAIRDIAERMTTLMTDVLGYDKFAIRGSDIGGSVMAQISLLHPERVIGNHTSGQLRAAGAGGDREPTEAEKKFARDSAAWDGAEMAYARLHASKPQTLANALNDSPAGLASWIVEKFRGWADTGGNVESRFTKDELLTNVTLYWVTQTIAPSVRLYYEFSRETDRAQGRVVVPSAMLMGPRDMVPPPREFSERTMAFQRWTDSPRGGHFMEWEEPELVARDMREFFSGLGRN